jgi:hypothetical protein
VNSDNYVYLASPYTHKDPKVREVRYKQVYQCYKHLLQIGLSVHCPIASSHEVDKDLGRLPPAHWYHIDLPLMQRASALFVLKLEGWQDSVGVVEEITYFTEAHKPIFYLMGVPNAQR